MIKWKTAIKQWTLALASTASLLVGVFALQSCAGEGGSVGGGGGGNGGGESSLAQQFRALLPEAQASANFVGSDRCGDCHGAADRADGDGNVFTHWQGTQHFEAGVGCEQCHGPGGAHAASPSESNILNLPDAANAVVCGQCHTQTYQEWEVSKHSDLIATPVEEAGQQPSRYGRQLRCMACHSGLAKVEQEEGLDLGTLDDEGYLELSEDTINRVPHSATCVTCHNPHAKTGNLTDDGEDVQLWRATFSTDTTTVGPGALPAQTTAFDHICASCHNGRGANPADAALASGTARPNMHDSNQYNMLMGFGGVEGSGPVVRNTAHATTPGQCSHCHMPDARHTFTVSYDKGCQPCHTAADAAARVTSVRSQTISALFALRQRLEAWALAELGDEDFWEYTSTITGEGKTPPDQTLVPIEVKRARHNYYFVLRDKGFGPHNAPYANHLIAVANQNLDALSAPAAVATEGRSAQDKLKVLEGDLKRTRVAEHESPE